MSKMQEIQGSKSVELTKSILNYAISILIGLFVGANTIGVLSAGTFLGWRFLGFDGIVYSSRTNNIYYSMLLLGGLVGASLLLYAKMKKESAWGLLSFSRKKSFFILGLGATPTIFVLFSSLNERFFDLGIIAVLLTYALELFSWCVLSYAFVSFLMYYLENRKKFGLVKTLTLLLLIVISNPLFLRIAPSLLKFALYTEGTIR